MKLFYYSLGVATTLLSVFLCLWWIVYFNGRCWYNGTISRTYFNIRRWIRKQLS